MLVAILLLKYNPIATRLSYDVLQGITGVFNGRKAIAERNY